MNCLHTNYHLKVIHMINLTTNYGSTCCSCQYLGRRVGRTCYFQTCPISYTIDWGRCGDHIDYTVTHASEVFKIPNIILKDTHVAKRLGFKLVHSIEPIDTTNEKHVDDLVTSVEQIILGD